MPTISSVQNPPHGFAPNQQVFIGRPRGAAATKGQVWMLDLAQSDGDTDTSAVGQEGSVFANLVASTAAGVESGIFAVALENIAEDKQGRWLLEGIADVLVQKGSGNIAIGDALVSTATQKYLDADVTAGAKFLGKALEAVTGPSTAATAKVWFDGVNGFGVHVS